MSSATADAIACPTCGKKYVGKPEFVGKQVRCKCGTVIVIPVASIPPPPMPASSTISAVEQPPAMAPLTPVIRPVAELDSDDLYDLVAEKAPPPVRAPTTTQPKREFIPIIVPGLEDDTDCPSCEHRMQPGAIICTHCGFNMKTGEKPQRTAAAVKSSVVAFANLGRSVKPVPVEHDRQEWLKILIPFAAILIVIAGAFGGYALIGRLHKTPPAKGNDAQIIKWLDDPGGKEIHEWFKQDPSRVAGQYSPSQAIAKADELQQLGAKQVLAFGPRMTLSLGVELPDDPDQRKALFAWESKYALEHNYLPDSDVGQKYLLLRLNP